MQLYRTPGPMGEQYIQADDLEIPEWIEEITDELYPSEDVVWVSSIKDICQGGCSSGAYMPAVTYSRALQTMHSQGNEVMAYIWEQLGEWPSADLCSNPSWSGLACHYLSLAVELWAGSVMAEIEQADEANEEVNQ